MVCSLQVVGGGSLIISCKVALVRSRYFKSSQDASSLNQISVQISMIKELILNSPVQQKQECGGFLFSQFYKWHLNLHCDLR